MKLAYFKSIALLTTSLFLSIASDAGSETDFDQSIFPGQLLFPYSERVSVSSVEKHRQNGDAGVPGEPAGATPFQVLTIQQMPVKATLPAQDDPAPEPIALEAARPAPASVTTDHYKPHVLVTWQLQLQGDLNTSYGAQLYVVDLFDTPKAEIANLQSQAVAVICYFSAGTYEEWRTDAGDFRAAELGARLDDWPGERWLDVRSRNVRNIMINRLDLAREKGCDGVDPDNVDGYSNPTGIDLSASDQLSFNRFLSTQAHERALAIGLKNNVEQVDALASHYDFTINESCDRYNECDRLNVFIAQGKPVLHVEYRPDLRSRPAAFRAFCQNFMDKQFSTLVLPRALDDEYRLSCH